MEARGATYMAYIGYMDIMSQNGSLRRASRSATSIRFLQPPHTLRRGILAPDGIVYPRRNIRARIFRGRPQGRIFTFRINRLADRLPVKRHADFHSITRPMQSGIGQQRQKRNHEQRNDQSDPVQNTPSWK